VKPPILDGLSLLGLILLLVGLPAMAFDNWLMRILGSFAPIGAVLLVASYLASGHPLAWFKRERRRRKQQVAMIDLGRARRFSWADAQILALFILVLASVPLLFLMLAVSYCFSGHPTGWLRRRFSLALCRRFGHVWIEDDGSMFRRHCRRCPARQWWTYPRFRGGHWQ
jgi:hypothetical protein